MIRFVAGVFLGSAILSSIPLFLNQTNFAAAALQRGSLSAHAKKVEELFNQNCARCHGPDGKGDTPLGHLYNAPDFTDSNWWKKNSKIASAKSLRLVVASGRAGMPGFEKKLSKSEIKLLVDRVRKFKN